MRSMHNMTGIIASSNKEVKKLILLIAEYPGPVYFRISRSDFQETLDVNDDLKIGKGRILEN